MRGRRESMGEMRIGQTANKETENKAKKQRVSVNLK